MTRRLYRVKSGQTPRKAAVGLTLIFCLDACQRDDRVALVSCASPLNDSLTVVRREASSAKGRIAFLSALKLAPGSVFEVDAIKPDVLQGNIKEVYLLRTSPDDFLPPRVESWVENVVGADFDLQLDDDVRQTLRSNYQELRKQIARNTVAGTPGARRRELRDPLSLLNADGQAVHLIESRPAGKKMALVYAVSYGPGTALFYSAPTPAHNTLGVPHFYLHLQYACSIVDKINGQPHSSVQEIPILFFPMAVRFDRQTGRVVADDTPFEP